MRKTNLKITIGSLVIVAAIFYLIFAGFSSTNAAYYLHVGEAIDSKVIWIAIGAPDSSSVLKQVAPLY